MVVMAHPDWFDSWFNKRFETKASYSPQEIAEALGETKDKIYRAILCGDLEAFKLGRRSYNVPLEALQK